MAALDTNVLVRFVVRDDGPRSRAAARLVEKCVGAGQMLFVPVTVTLELEWVLRASFGYTKQEVIGVLSGLFSAVELIFDSDRALEVALQLYRQGSADFADGLHIALAAQAGALPLWTFDKQAAKLGGARLVGMREVRRVRV